MKAVVQSILGEPAKSLELRDIAEPGTPGPGEVVIDVTLAPIHHGDLHLVRSQSELPDDTGYLRRGSEAVGVVRALGADVEKVGALKVGTRVVGFPAIGAWAEQVVVPGPCAIPIPDDLSDEVAAQLFINFVTARMIVRGLRKSVADEALKDGAVLVTGASTVVARLLLHFLKKEGLNPIGLARSEDAARRVSDEIGGVPVAATGGGDWQSEVEAHAGERKIVGVLDCVSGGLVKELLPLLADDAAIVTYGSLDKNPMDVAALQIVDHQFVIRGVTFTRWFAELTPDEQKEDVASAIALARELPSLFTAGGVFGLDDFQSAVSAVEEPNRRGFVFLKPR